MKTDRVQHLKKLEKENKRLRKAVSDLRLEKLILKEAVSEVRTVLETVSSTVS